METQMPEIELTDQQVAEFEQRLLDAIPPQGSIGNSALRRRLEWSEDRYWYITNRLLRTGAVEQGRGRGGSIHRVAPLQTPPAAATPHHYELLNQHSTIRSSRQYAITGFLTTKGQISVE
jgi:hypothetical protein